MSIFPVFGIRLPGFFSVNGAIISAQQPVRGLDTSSNRSPDTPILLPLLSDLLPRLSPEAADVQSEFSLARAAIYWHLQGKLRMSLF
ncbi:hypothetical protein NMD14_16035 [Aeromonas veronii]